MPSWYKEVLIFKILVFEQYYCMVSEKVQPNASLLQDGVVHYGEAVLQDFSAQCVREFLHWSIKQTSEKVCAKKEELYIALNLFKFGKFYDNINQMLLHLAMILPCCLAYLSSLYCARLRILQYTVERHFSAM